MRVLVDGYNLLFASSVFVPEGMAPTLSNTRDALLDFLAETIAAKLLPQTTVVFDAAQAPPGLPKEMQHRGMRIVFSAKKSSADEVLEDLLDNAKQPKELLVISSDHRIQRAARQKGAKYVDSEQWLKEQAANRKAQKQQSSELKPELPSSEDAAHWIEAFQKKK